LNGTFPERGLIRHSPDCQRRRRHGCCLERFEQPQIARSPYAAAARAADVSGLPPTYISVGGLDLFLEENMIYADRLSRAGVPVELHMYPRAYHGFYRVTNARVTKQAEHDNREALRRFLHG
jgi:acetyl esterase/lipase